MVNQHQWVRTLFRVNWWYGKPMRTGIIREGLSWGSYACSECRLGTKVGWMSVVSTWHEFLLTVHNMCTSLPHPGPCPSKHLQVSVLFLSEHLLKISSACSHSDGSQWPRRCSLILLSEVQSRERLGGGCMYSNTGAERKEIEEGIQI